MRKDFLKSALRFVFLAGSSLFASSVAMSAPQHDLTEWSAPASGADSWTGLMGRTGTFASHANNCAGSEVFVQVGSNSDGVAVGFCIDKNENAAGASSWQNARQACLSADKRLPEPGEFVYACLNATGLSNMTNDFEWSTNFTSNALFDALTPRQGVGATAIGNQTCTTAAVGWVATSDDAPSSLSFRCVH